ncbi:hypothetical protein IAT38_001191 [Cryptococcus sp. DSM 104549]
MQRGITRQRSPSPSDDTPSRPKQRIRQSAASPPPTTTSPHTSFVPKPQPQPTQAITSFPARSSHSKATTHMSDETMGQPIHNGSPTNGHAAGSATASGGGSTSAAGPSTSNGHDHALPSSQPNSLPPHILSSIQKVQPEGSLVYDDDRDWREAMERSHGVDGADEVMEDGESYDAGRLGRGKIPRPGVGGGKRMPIEREEAVRLMLQAMRDIGYNQSADVLEAESGYRLSTQAATDFQAAILGGRWSEALALLPELGIPAPSTAPPASSSSSIASGKTRATVTGKGTGSVADQTRFLIAQQKYLEYLEVGQQKKALGTLRGELARVAKDQDVLHTLSGFMMCLNKEDLYDRAMWDGAAGTSRRQLLEHLQTFISPQIMVPSRRLATLFDQARRQQQTTCMYHEDPEATSLYVDHRCETGEFPSVTTHVLVDHRDEVWRIEWSPDGNLLASAGKDRVVIIWELERSGGEDGNERWDVVPRHHLKEHDAAVDAMAWSPDGNTLVTCADKYIYLWDGRTGAQLPNSKSSSQHTDTISGVAWLPDGSEFIVTSMDCKVVFYSADGTLLRQWTTYPLQIRDLVVTQDGKRIVCISTPLKRVHHNDKLRQSMSGRPAEGTEMLELGGPGAQGQFGFATMENSIVAIRIEDHEIVDWSQDLRCEMTSIRMSSDGRRVVVSCSPDEIQEWSIHGSLRYLRKHTGHIQGNFLIRSSFGAPKDQFILSGSEDGHVYVWHGAAPTPVEVLSGHDNVVNAVAWNPIATRKIFASCSDDSTVRVWQPPVDMDFSTDGLAADGRRGDGAGGVGGSGATNGGAADEPEAMIL